jgi:hypothetical protein
VHRRRRVVSACIAAVALGALSACSSQPGNRRVVADVIGSLQLPAAQEACMLDKLEGYTDDELDAIARENENWDPAETGETPADASEGMRLFIADFEQCTTEGGATGTSEPAATTGSTEPAATTQRTQTTLG